LATGSGNDLAHLVFHDPRCAGPLETGNHLLGFLKQDERLDRAPPLIGESGYGGVMQGRQHLQHLGEILLPDVALEPDVVLRGEGS